MPRSTPQTPANGLPHDPAAPAVPPAHPGPAAPPPSGPHHYPALDGTRLAHTVLGDGPPLVCLPGGPAPAAYLGDLGGLSAHRRLILPDPRGTGASGRPAGPAALRCDRHADDIEALRRHLGLERLDLLAHCAGANPAVQYAARHPDRVRRLALITPSVRAVGLAVPGAARRRAALVHRRRPWFPDAFAALEAVLAGTGSDWAALAPFSYGRWDDAARAHHAAVEAGTDPAVAAAFGAEGAFDPAATRAGLAALAAPVLVLAGEGDTAAPPEVLAGFAALLPAAEFTVRPGAAHHPWRDDPAGFAAVVRGFLE